MVIFVPPTLKLEKENQPPRDIAADVKFFISLAKKYHLNKDITFTYQMLLELVEDVVVHEKCKETQRQQVDVYFNHLGLIDRDILEELGTVRENTQLKRVETAKNLSKETAAKVRRKEIKAKKVDENTAKKIIISEVVLQTQDNKAEIKREKIVAQEKSAAVEQEPGSKVVLFDNQAINQKYSEQSVPAVGDVLREQDEPARRDIPE